MWTPAIKAARSRFSPSGTSTVISYGLNVTCLPKMRSYWNVKLLELPGKFAVAAAL